jgi:hypothetical protein
MVTVDRVTESDLDGFAVLEVYGEGKIRRFCNGDPSVRAGLIRFEISPLQVHTGACEGILEERV